MIISAEDFRLNFYNILKMVKDNGENIKIRSVYGDFDIIENKKNKDNEQ